jgi:2-polyprenyl-3-methyl-5-hydroxy-6-metoxy-1,4-benzoquinol methylase
MLEWRRVKANRIIAEVDRYVALKHTPQLDILDAGCGGGFVAFQLADKGHWVVGVDISEKAIESCRKCIAPVADFYIGNIASMRLDKSFDVIVCSEVLEHIDHVDIALCNLYDHLKSNGLLILTVPNGYSLRELFINRTALGRLISRHAETDWFDSKFQQHVNFWTLQQIKALLIIHGFELLKVVNIGLAISPPRFIRPLAIIEHKVDLQVPHALAGGWLITATK